LGVYGGYSYGKSNLDKYKTDAYKKVDNNATINKPLITPDIKVVLILSNKPIKNPSRK
jgi:hypothetical protein